MKIFLLSLFVAAAFAAPAPLDEDTGEPVELIVNGVSEGEPLEIGDVLGIKVKEHVDGVIVSATDLLHPLTAAGIEEAAANERPNEEEEDQEVGVIPEPVELPPPMIPEIIPPIDIPDASIPVLIPEPIELPQPVLPEIVLPETPEIELPVWPAPEVVPPALLPEIVPPGIEDPVDVLPAPEVEDPAEVFPVPDPEIPNGEIFNNGVVQVTLNAPESEVLSTVQSWFNMVLNYFNGSYVTTHQIV